MAAASAYVAHRVSSCGVFFFCKALTLSRNALAVIWRYLGRRRRPRMAISANQAKSKIMALTGNGEWYARQSARDDKRVRGSGEEAWGSGIAVYARRRPSLHVICGIITTKRGGAYAISAHAPARP